MSDGTEKHGGNHGNGSQPDPDEAALSARLGSLNDRLSKTLGDRKLQADQSDTGSGNAQARASAMAVGLRLSSELVAGVVVGTILGWVFDRLLSTSPWGLIVFMLLGFVAGVMNVMRSAGVGKKS
jgi:ATP synthase protein I